MGGPVDPGHKFAIIKLGPNPPTGEVCDILYIFPQIESFFQIKSSQCVLTL